MHWIRSWAGQDPGSEQHEAWRRNGNTFHYSKRKSDKHSRLIMCTVFGLAASLLAKNIVLFVWCSCSLPPLSFSFTFFFQTNTHTLGERTQIFYALRQVAKWSFKTVYEDRKCVTTCVWDSFFVSWASVLQSSHDIYMLHSGDIGINDDAKFLKQMNKIKSSNKKLAKHIRPPFSLSTNKPGFVSKRLDSVSFVRPYKWHECPVSSLSNEITARFVNYHKRRGCTGIPKN